MKEQEILNELDSIIALCDVMKDKATGLRRKLSPVEGATSRKRGVVSQAEIDKVLTDLRKYRNRKAEKNKV